MKQWDVQSKERRRRIAAGSSFASGKAVDTNRLAEFLGAVIRPGDRVCLEGNNQKRADVLARALADADPHDLHMVQSGVVLPEHLDLFEKGIAKKLDFSYSGPQAARIARMLFSGKIELGAIHTYLELFARYFVDLTPQVALITAVSADRDGNLYTGPNTEDTPTVVEATSFGNGIVIAQVGEIVDKVPRVDIPGDQVHFFVNSGKPFYVEPLFTRDPAAITGTQILTAMLAIKGLYMPYGVRRLNHGIGFNTAAIELLLPTYGEKLGLRGKICTHRALNPHPTLIPAIETGWVTSMPDTCSNETNSIKHRSQDRSSDHSLRASWQSAASSPDEDVGLLPKPSCVPILERLSQTTIAVSWCDATAGHYGDQIWTAGIADRRALCALTGAYIHRGDAVYRPRRSRTQLPANFDRMILASALPQRESVPATDTVVRASTRPASHKHHVTPIQQPDVPAARKNTEAIQRLQRT